MISLILFLHIFFSPLKIPRFHDVAPFDFGQSKLLALKHLKKPDNDYYSIIQDKDFLRYSYNGSTSFAREKDTFFLYCNKSLYFKNNKLIKVVLKSTVPNLQTDSLIALKLFNIFKNNQVQNWHSVNYYKEGSENGYINCVWEYFNYSSSYKIRLKINLLKEGNKFYCLHEYDQIIVTN